MPEISEVIQYFLANNRGLAPAAAFGQKERGKRWLTPVRAIRQKCLDCCNGQSAEVRLCTCKTCPLYGCRMGHRPKGEQFTTETYREEKSPRSLGIIVTERK